MWDPAPSHSAVVDWFAQFVALVGAAFSAAYGAVSAVPGFVDGRAAPRLRLLIVGVVFAGTAMVIQLGLMLLVGAAGSFTWLAVAYSLIGALEAVLIFRSHFVRHDRRPPAGRLGCEA